MSNERDPVQQVPDRIAETVIMSVAMSVFAFLHSENALHLVADAMKVSFDTREKFRLKYGDEELANRKFDYEVRCWVAAYLTQFSANFAIANHVSTTVGLVLGKPELLDVGRRLVATYQKIVMDESGKSCQ